MQQTPQKQLWEMARTLFFPILAGLLTAQIIATWFVYGSNTHLYEAVQAAQKADYFVIPAGPVTTSLTTFKSAIWGGLFYTLSIGGGLTLVTWAALHLWQRVLQRRNMALGVYLAIWLGLVVWINLKGFTLFPTLFCTMVPLATAIALVKFSSLFKVRRGYQWLAPVATLMLLTGVWATQLNSNLFTTIRDHILLSNPVGQAVNDFYYRYTLYAAQSFKSLNQKTVRTYTMAPINDPHLKQKIARRMARYDMLYLPGIERPDFTIALEKERLVLTAAGGNRIDAPPDKVLAKPYQWLQQLSKASDRYAPLRRITLVSLLVGFPILLYMTVYGIICAAMRVVLTERTATLAASVLCLVIGLLLFIPMLDSQPSSISEKDIAQALTADQWPQRVAALRYIEKHKVEIGRYPQYKPLLSSPLVVERYWLARALSTSRSPATYTDLNAMLGDPHPNVTCQVFYALGRRANRAAIAPIKAQMAVSDHWYAQWYGYRAIRRLGWYPSPLK